MKMEAALVNGYCDWLAKQGRRLHVARYKNLQCDGYEQKRQNLIEAKALTRREHIRMAVGQLLDYGFLGENKFGVLNKAILLPSKPSPHLVDWLEPLNIKVIWQEKGAFLDNANGQFC